MERDSLSQAMRAQSVYVGTVISAQAAHLLAARGYIGGDEESGFRWTTDGGSWVRDLIDGAAEKVWSDGAR